MFIKLGSRNTATSFLQKMSIVANGMFLILGEVDSAPVLQKLEGK